ncbi:hemin-degrading factor [Pelagibius marinus]|uniref:hemin-degrading factor n=1 Tax=Pelagibius marinus TaxID=2762760 RepID=UPI0018726835|nr:ChuX/HutX family heme-like substrate-binding protein [Pelagibius marinus]
MQEAELQGGGPALRQRWLALRDEEPGLRARDAAARLGVSEGELLAARCGEGVRRLDGPWPDLLKELPGLGTVMVLTRNESAVHEKTGRFDKVSAFKDMGLVLNGEIDLRVFFNHWHFGFAVTEEAHGKARHSLQFFDRDGMAVHKVYLREDDKAAAYEALVTKHLHGEQSPGIEVAPAAPAPADRADHLIDRAALRERWEALQDVHDFREMLIDLGAGRLQAFRLAGGDKAYRVAPGSFRQALEQAAAAALPIMIFVGSPGVVQIHSGPVKTLKQVGPWFNVLDPGFNLHLREDGVAEAWVVRKPTRDGIVTSLEIYDGEGRQIAWMFGERGEGQAELAEWRALVDALPPQGVAVQ